MKKLLVALIASNLIILSAVAMAPRRMVYPESAASASAKGVAHTKGAYSPLGTSKRIAPAQAEKSRRLVYPSKASVQAERAAAVKNLKGVK